MKPALPLITLAHCSMILGDEPVLNDVSFTLRAGERWALIGPNGAGKTLLLKMLRGDVWPTPTGRERRTYAFGGRASREPAGSKEHIAYVGPERQDKYVRYGWNLSVQALVTTGLFDEDIPLTRATPAQRARVARIMKRFGLWGLRNRKLLALSYGQRRLALVARAFASAAPVLLLDEVFNGLDTKTRDKLRRALEAPRAGHTWVLTTHRPKELPSNVTHAAYIEQGRIVQTCAVGDRPLPNRCIGTYEWRGAQDARERPPPRSAREGTRRKTLRSLAQERRSTKQSASAPCARASMRPRHSHLPVLRRAGVGAVLVRLHNVDLYRDYRPVIRALNWTIAQGEHWAILGANGSGKSTLLSVLYGDLHPALGGTIERAGLAVGSRIEEWKRRVGWVSPELQADHAFAKSIEEIVISGRYSSVGLNEPPTARDRKLARKWLQFFDIEALRERGPRQVSYGQMRLALFARAMINEPELLLLDEPCTGLDGDVREHVLAVLQRLAESGTQIVMAVHDPEDIVSAVRHVLRIERARARQVTR